MRPVIAIDGPAGAGKSTVSRALAERLDLRYLDTGAMYRALALAADRAGTPDDENALAALLERVTIGFGAGSPAPVLLDGEDVSGLIRTGEIAARASAVSRHPAVRRAMVREQQALVAEGGVVLEGRDATTVIAPNATVKVYLTASLEERARRRTADLAGEFAAVRADIEDRDHRDITRADSPLTVAEDATVIDSANLPIDQVVTRIAALVP